MRTLLIEDDPLIGNGIKVGLGKLGLPVDWFTQGREGELALKTTEYDAVILDLTLPDKDGLEILKSWREAGYSVPVLVLTARSTLDQKIEGLDCGADDYLPKPFALQELAARLRALVRRSHQIATPTLSHGNVTFHPSNHEVYQNDIPVNLSPKETSLLELFLLNKNNILSKNLIEEKLYLWGEEVSSNAVEYHIHHLRRKFGTGFIKTIRGIGYKLGDE